MDTSLCILNVKMSFSPLIRLHRFDSCVVDIKYSSLTKTNVPETGIISPFEVFNLVKLDVILFSKKRSYLLNIQAACLHIVHVVFPVNRSRISFQVQ